MTLRIGLACALAGVLACGSAAAQPAPAAPPAPAASATPVGATGLLSATLASTDLDRSIAFYTKGLGLIAARPFDSPHNTEVPLIFRGAGGASLLLVKYKPGQPADAGPAGVGRVIVNVPDLRATAARLAALGYPLAQPITEHPEQHMIVGLAKDPDGNALELVQLAR